MEQGARTPGEDTPVPVLKDSQEKTAIRVRDFPNFSCEELPSDAVSICDILYCESDLFLRKEVSLEAVYNYFK